MEQLSFEKENNLDAVLDSIMTVEKYAQIRHETPYIFTLKIEDTELYYFGAPHERDPQNSLFSEIETAFNQVNPDIVFVEGLHDRGDRDKFNEQAKNTSRDEVIHRAGESGFTLKLAVEKGIEWQSPEPSDEDLYNDLLNKGFSKDDIFARHVLNILPQYNRLMKKEGFKQYVDDFMDDFKQATNWEGFDYSYERAIELGQQILGRSISVENEPNALDFVDPIPWEEKKSIQTVLNRISTASSLFRDRKIVNDIASAIKTHKRVFVVYGASHAVMQEPALRKLS